MSSADKKVAVVSGGAGGIGAAVVSRLAQADFIPIILDKDEAAGREVLAKLAFQEGRGLCIALDATKKSEVQRALDRVLADYRRVDVLVNLAGGSLYTKLMQDFSLTEWREVIDANLKSTFLCCQAVLPIMKAQRQGAIINTASNYAVTGSARRTPYSAAKAAIVAFTKSLAAELAPYGVRANVIAPGRTATARVMGNYDSEGWTAINSQIPMGRAAEPAEIAEGVAFLAGDESLYMTGQTLHVNGGMVMP
ncbi:MAG: SDR family oxidoreductase [Deltaproteobacteria bacterium]|nr:SDR family oxidoreductase [Deltaproteobacteria bacterium]